MALSPEDPLSEFVALLKSEGRSGVLGLDCGQGADGLRFVRPASTSPASTRPRRTSIPRGPTGWKPRWPGPASLPFADSAFPSVWAVDALAGLPPEDWGDVVRELERVAAPGAPIAVVLPEPRSAGQGPGFTVLRSPA